MMDHSLCLSMQPGCHRRRVAYFLCAGMGEGGGQVLHAAPGSGELGSENLSREVWRW